MYYVYILTTQNNSVLYIGVTHDLQKRLSEHKNQTYAGFTKKYNVHKLVYYEYFNDISLAIAREKQLKGWKKSKKVALIETQNSNWNELEV